MVVNGFMDMSEQKGKRGRPTGISREGKYGTGVKTKVVRVPEPLANNIKDILDNFEQIRVLVDSWDEQVLAAKEASTKNKPSPRYDQAIRLLEELRGLID